MSLLPCFGRRPPKATGAPTPPKGQSGRGDLSHFLSNPRKVHSCTVTLDAHTPQLVGILLGGEPGVQRHPGTILLSPAPRVSTLRTSTGGVRAPSKHFNQSNATSPFAPPGARSRTACSIFQRTQRRDRTHTKRSWEERRLIERHRNFVFVRTSPVWTNFLSYHSVSPCRRFQGCFVSSFLRRACAIRRWALPNVKKVTRQTPTVTPVGTSGPPNSAST